ncbi:MAG TPA: GAF and ANTAR domain-containing protein [Acidimicrobiales bacterium]|jgi:GAF domain-containing protein|nr:GAF and ANTAR domain-containing protein [Acidimicrobiales bacterium]
MAEDPEAVVEALEALTRTLLDEETPAELLERVAELACRAIRPASVAGVTVMKNGEPAMSGTYGEAAAMLDAVQVRAKAGPCVDAARKLQVMRNESTRVDGAWPEFNRAAFACGVYSTLSLPLVVHGEGRGSLNLYARQDRAFADDDERVAIAFSEQAAVTIANSEMFWRTQVQTEQLRIALETRDVIGQAKGILMSKEHLTADEAFDRLRDRSQRLNIKLRTIAEQVTFTGELPDRPA